MYNQTIMGRKSLKTIRRKEILQSFSRVFATEGYSGATIQAVADEAGLSPGLLHHHFENKQEMLYELFDQLLERFNQAFQEQEKENYKKPLDIYLSSALALNDRSDITLARCWVGVLAEALKDPYLKARLVRTLDREILKIQSISGGMFDTKDASSFIAYILGSLVFGAFAPQKSKGFAYERGRKLFNCNDV